MKNIFLILVFISQFSSAEETNSPPTTQPSSRMTTRDAKKICKGEGKTGADLIKCMKDKKNEK